MKPLRTPWQWRDLYEFILVRAFRAHIDSMKAIHVEDYDGAAFAKSARDFYDHLAEECEMRMRLPYPPRALAA